MVITVKMDFTKGLSTDSTQLINVNGSADPYYRYKMECVMITQTNAKGGTTIVDNAAKIAHDIYREITDLKSCFAKGLSTRVSIQEDKLVISGRHTNETLQHVLQSYIMSSVLCKKCGNPETPVSRKNKRKCQACGYSWVSS